MTKGNPTSELPSKPVKTFVLGNGPLLTEEKSLLEDCSRSPGSRLFTANMAFANNLVGLPWKQRTAVLQDYVYQALVEEGDCSQLQELHDSFTEIVVVESLFPGVRYDEFDYSKINFLSHLRRIRLLNRIAKTRFFHFNEEYLPSTGIVTLAIAIDRMNPRRLNRTVGLVGIGLDHRNPYSHQVPSLQRFQDLDHSELDAQGHEVFSSPRNHTRPDALAIAAFSYHCHIYSARPEVLALTTTWLNKTWGNPKELHESSKDLRHTFSQRIRNLLEQGRDRIRRTGFRSTFALALRQVRRSHRYERR